MEKLKKYVIISMPIVVFVLVLISFILTEKERAEDIIYGATVYEAREVPSEEKVVEVLLLECERFCNYTREFNKTQPEFMLKPLTDTYCLLGFNETLYNYDKNSNGVLEFIPCPEIYGCLINFENIGIIKLNCTK